MAWFKRTSLKRQYYRRVLSPANRLQMNPRLVGRSFFVGLLWGLTATVGFQVIGVAVFWVVGRILRAPFSIAIALVLTFVTNPLTMVPIYSTYFVTGCGLLGCEADIYSPRAVLALVGAEGWLGAAQTAWHFLVVTLLGSLPFAIPSSIAGYLAGCHVGRRLQTRRLKRLTSAKDRREEVARLHRLAEMPAGAQTRAQIRAGRPQEVDG